jgi:outer membrane receptor protein involved in Fe transport
MIDGDPMPLRDSRLRLLPLRPAVLAIACAWGLAQTGPARAQASPPGTPPVSSDTVVIIGVSPLPGLGMAKDRVPSNVQTAGAAEIEGSHAIDLTAFLSRRLGSVYVNEVQNNPFQPDVNFRGYSASPLLGTQQGLSIYLDGVRLNQPFGDVVSWDLLPKSAIASITLMPGSNPLFGLNTLGGALSVQTKDGLKNPGTSVQVLAGSHKRVALEFETGGGQAAGLHWFVTGNKFQEDGWRVASKSDVQQLFSKFGFKAADTALTFTAAVARTDLNGNGLQEQRFLARDYASVYTKPDNTRNRALLLSLALAQSLGENLSFTGNGYWRKIKTHTYNGDVNDNSFDQALYQPNAGEQAALTAAGYSGFPASGEDAGNSSFPKWRCIANALLLVEPGVMCNGVINQTFTDQSNHGLSGQFNLDARLGGLPLQLVAGAAIDISRSQFTQGSELGYLNPDHSITGVGALGDGVSGGVVDGEPYDTRVDLSGRTRTYSVYGSAMLALNPGTHLTLSGRYNRISVKNRDAIIAGGGAGSLDGDHSYSRFNPAVGLTITPFKGLNAYAGLSQGSRAPSSIELGCADPANPCKLPNSFAGDPPLRQVVTTTLEAGFRGGMPGGVVWNVGVFRSDNKDDLLFVADDAAGFGYFKNFGRTRRQGVEAGASLQVAKGVSVGANYTFLDATFRSPEVVDGSSNSSNAAAADGFPGVQGTIGIRPGDRIPLVPRQILKLFTDLQLGESFSVGLDVTGIGSSLARGNENGQHHADGVYYLGTGRNAGFSVLNLSVEIKPAAGLKLFMQLNNVFDRKYSTAAQLGVTGFNDAGSFEARPFPADANGDRPARHATFFAPGAPRSFWVGLKYTFGGV